jgi:molybdopterin/thiamine biosynthesis adenylyltransferase/rhodanese-related sulfurtransferase
MGYKAGNERYQRQTSLKELGERGQQKLYQARVLVIGAGGLGCPALQYLAGAGIGTIGIVDHDIVSLSNLHRQIIYSTDDAGLSKSIRAAEILSELNPEIEIIPYNQLLNSENAAGIISNFDIILDGTDNFASRYLINDACVLLDKPLIYGAISKFEGQVSVFNYSVENGKRSANYRDLFPDPPAENEIQNCEEAGVMGVLPGIIGNMMANETIKLITGLGEILLNRLLTYNSLNNQIYELEFLPRLETRSLIPKNLKEFEQTDYDLACSSSAVYELDPGIFENMINKPGITIVDVREAGEAPVISDFEHLNIPLSILRENLSGLDNEIIILFCQSGKRSLSAAKIISERYGDSKKVYSLKGGIVSRKNLKKA